MDELAITVEKVSKDFRLPNEKVASLKGHIIHPFKRRKFSTQHALKDVSLEIKKGEFFGIVGRNGSGKSTLLKIIAGIYQPSSGKLSVSGKLVPFIELGVGFNPELSGRDNVYLNGALLGFSKSEIDRQYDDIVEFAELQSFMDQKLKNYSSGMQVRLAFSMAVRAKADILLLDEVLAVGDADFQRKCFDYFKTLKKNKKTVVFVSHDMNAVREFCDRAVLIESSKVIARGTADKVATKYTQLFIEEAKSGQGNKKGSRWGDEALKYSSIKLDSQKVTNQTNIKIYLTAKAKQDVKNPNFGFLIKTAAGAPVLGTNTQIKKQQIDFVKKGQTIKLEWTVPNVFSDGTHYIDPAIVYQGGYQVADWWEEALSFKVYKEEKTPYITTPPVDVVYEVS